MQTNIKTICEFIREAQSIICFTGAGISTESGIPDYRSQGGIWQRFQPITIQEFLQSHDKRKQYWDRKLALYQSLRQAQPNLAHQALVQLERLGKLEGLITQNIDGLHRQAGFPKEKIIEIHGTNLEIICLSCANIYTWETVFDGLGAGQDIPLCPQCAGYLKPNTISFGQSLKTELLERSFRWAQSCDLMIAVGSTLVVEPAASIPRIAKQNNARLVIITLSETPLDRVADVKISASCAEVLDQVVQNL